MIFSLCNSHLIWMFWGKNLEPFWIIIEQCYKDCSREAIITRCDVFIISLLRSDDLPKEMRRQATIQEFSPSKAHTKLHRHLLDTNGFTSTFLCLVKWDLRNHYLITIMNIFSMPGHIQMALIWTWYWKDFQTAYRLIYAFIWTETCSTTAQRSKVLLQAV